MSVKIEVGSGRSAGNIFNWSSSHSGAINIWSSLSLSPFDVVIGKIDTAIIWSNVWQLNCHQPDRKSIFICTTTSYNIELCSNTKGSYKSCGITLFSIHISCSSNVNNQSWILNLPHFFMTFLFYMEEVFNWVQKRQHAKVWIL